MPLIGHRTLVVVTVVTTALGLAPLSTHAQAGRVDGIVYDSLRMQPLAGAIVQLVAAPPARGAYSATTDPRGRFQLAGVRAGQYNAGFLHPLLDTLGVLAPYGSVMVAESAEAHVALAIPSAQRIASAICAPAMGSHEVSAADTTGTVVGHVYDARTGSPVGSGVVSVMWPVLTVEAHGVHRETRQLHATTGENGWFALCALDPGDYQLRAESGTRSTGYVDLTLQARDIARVTLVLGGDAAAGASLAGKVTGTNGRPLEGAQVVVEGSTASATTDARGAFALSGLPDGTRMVEARALGYAPARAAVTPSREEPPVVTIVMDQRVETLHPVTVFGKESARVRDLTGFAERSRRGFGHFITRAQIDAESAVSMCDMLRRTPGVTVASDGGIGCGASIRAMGSPDRCEPTVYVDNMKFGGSVRELTRTVSPRELAGVELYSSATEPAQFPGGCGAIVVWTR